MLLSALIVLVGHVLPILACSADCDGDHNVTLRDLTNEIELLLETPTATPCAGADTDGNGQVSVDEIVAGVNETAHSCTPQTQAFVVTTNFMAGSFATIDLDEPRTVSRSSSQRRVHSDAVARTHGGLVYVVNRRFGDNLQVLDPAANFQTRMQCSTGNGSNPHDIAFASTDKAYVTLYEGAQLLIVNPAARPDCSDFVRGSIDLSAAADADGIPDMDLMVVVGQRLYVALGRLDINTILRLPAGNGAIAVIDINTDTLVDIIELSGQNPFGATKGLVAQGDKLYVSEAGLFNEVDGGIERVDLTTGKAEGFFITESDLGGDVTDFVLVSNHLAYAIVSRPGFSSALIAFDPLTRQVTQTVAVADGFTFSDIELNDRGELFLADRNRKQNGIRIFRATDGVPLVDQTIDLGLSPIEIVFIP